MDQRQSSNSTQNRNGGEIAILSGPPPGLVPGESTKWVTPEPERRSHAKRLKVKDDSLKIVDGVIICLGEIIGAFILEFVGCISVVGDLIKGEFPSILQISLVFGFAILIAVTCVGHISGCHINPIITLASVILGHTSLIKLPIYYLGQLIGCIIGYGFIMLITPAEFMGGKMVNGKYIVGVCAPEVNPRITEMQGFGMEFLISFILTFTACGVWDARNANKHDSVPIKFGLTVAALAVVGIPYTGAHMNPARTLAPSILMNEWKNIWVYMVAPMLAAAAAAVLYRFAFSRENVDSDGNALDSVATN